MAGQTEDSNPAPLYLPTSPEEVLLNDSDSALLSSRFRPEQRARITQDLEHENSILAKYIEKGGLRFWFKSLLASAEKATTNPISTEALPQPVSDTEHKEDLSTETGSSFRKERLSWL
jgi:nuclear pore complex protein Nup133